MILILTELPSLSATHGSHNPNVTVPLFSIAPRISRGSNVTAIVLVLFGECAGLGRMLKQQQPACLVFDLNIPESHGRSRMRLQVRLTARRLLPVPVVVVAFANLMSHNC